MKKLHIEAVVRCEKCGNISYVCIDLPNEDGSWNLSIKCDSKDCVSRNWDTEIIGIYEEGEDEH